MAPIKSGVQVVPARSSHQDNIYTLNTKEKYTVSPMGVQVARHFDRFGHGKLNPLQDFHRLPIDPVVYWGSSPPIKSGDES